MCSQRLAAQLSTMYWQMRGSRRRHGIAVPVDVVPRLAVPLVAWPQSVRFAQGYVPLGA